jgi:hypothetical protein
MNITKLPVDCIMTIFEYLCAPQIKACACTCAPFAAIIKTRKIAAKRIDTPHDFIVCASAGHTKCIASWFGQDAEMGVCVHKQVLVSSPYLKCVRLGHYICVDELRLHAPFKTCGEYYDTYWRRAAQSAWHSKKYEIVLHVLDAIRDEYDEHTLILAKKCIVHTVNDRRVPGWLLARVLARVTHDVAFIKKIVAIADGAGLSVWRQIVYGGKNGYRGLSTLLELLNARNNAQDARDIATELVARFSNYELYCAFKDGVKYTGLHVRYLADILLSKQNQPVDNVRDIWVPEVQNMLDHCNHIGDADIEYMITGGVANISICDKLLYIVSSARMSSIVRALDETSVNPSILRYLKDKLNIK